MDTPDLSRLKIDRGAATSRSSTLPLRRRRWTRIAIAVIIAAVLAIAAASRFGSGTSVETATVALAYSSQNYTLLNATGYVAAQRKAALSSKASGRLEWLGVLEGSHVTKDDLVARLENRDVAASLGQATANVKVAQANQQQGMAELRDAGRALRRSQELLRQNYISAAAHDAAVARDNKAKAAIAGLQAAIAAAEATQQAAQVALDQTLIRAPFDGVVLTKNANVGDNITPFSSATDSKGANGGSRSEGRPGHHGDRTGNGANAAKDAITDRRQTGVGVGTIQIESARSQLGQTAATTACAGRRTGS